MSSKPHLPMHLPVYNGPSFQGLRFVLTSSNIKAPRTLMVQTQIASDNGRAYITGTWQGDGVCDMTGDILDEDGTISITCEWANDRIGPRSGQTGADTLIGSLFFRGRVRIGNVYTAPVWLLQGGVTVVDGDGVTLPSDGPGKVFGTALADRMAGSR